VILAVPWHDDHTSLAFHHLGQHGRHLTLRFAGKHCAQRKVLSQARVKLHQVVKRWLRNCHRAVTRGAQQRCGCHPGHLGRFDRIDGGRLLRRQGRNKKARIEAFRHIRGRDPMSPVDQSLDIQAQVFFLQQRGKPLGL
jgi:hypothetical protein